MDNLDDFLNVPAPQAAEPEPQPEAIVEEPKTGPERGPDGKFISKGETDAPPASIEEEKVPLAAIKDERRKRQDLEARLAEYEQKLQALSAPPQPAPDMYDDPDAWQKHFGTQVTQQATTQAAMNARLDMSEMMAAQAHQDFDDVRPKILEFMEANPALREQILGDRHPWNRAYQLVKNHERMTALGATNVEELEAKIRAEVTAQIEAEAKAKTVDIPDSLAGAQSGRGGLPDGSPTSLDSILGPSK